MAVNIKKTGKGILPTTAEMRENTPPPKAKIKVSMKRNPKGEKQSKAASAPKRGLPRKTDPEKANLSTEQLNDMLAEDGVPVGEEWERRRNNPDGARIRATAEERDYRLKQILRLILRGVPRKTIAEHLGLSMPQLEKDIKELNQHVKDEVSNMDFPLFIGMTLNFFDEARNIALRTATDTKEASNMTKMRALDTALKAEVEKHKYLQLVGLYNNPIPQGTFGSIGGPSTGSDESDVKRFMQLLHSAGQTIDVVPAPVERSYVPREESMDEIIHEVGLMDLDVREEQSDKPTTEGNA